DDPDRQHGCLGGIVAAVSRWAGSAGVQHRDAVGHRHRHVFVALYRRAHSLLRPAEPRGDHQIRRGVAGSPRARSVIDGQHGRLGTPMDLTPLIPAGRQVIERYSPSGFRITGIIHRGAVLVFPDCTLPWAVANASAVTWKSLAPVVEHG